MGTRTTVRGRPETTPHVDPMPCQAGPSRDMPSLAPPGRATHCNAAHGKATKRVRQFAGAR